MFLGTECICLDVNVLIMIYKIEMWNKSSTSLQNYWTREPYLRVEMLSLDLTQAASHSDDSDGHLQDSAF